MSKDQRDPFTAKPQEENNVGRLHGEWLAWLCCDATDVCLECVLAKSSAYMGNSCVYCMGASQTGAFTWGKAGLVVL